MVAGLAYASQAAVCKKYFDNICCQIFRDGSIHSSSVLRVLDGAGVCVAVLSGVQLFSLGLN